MNDPRVIFPDDFDDFAWEVEAKGWISGVVVEFDGKSFHLCFYDVARLTQDIDHALGINAAFIEKNVVVIRSVTRAEIERAVQFIASSDGFTRLKNEL